MQTIFEQDTYGWHSNYREMNAISIQAAKQYHGKKFSVAIGEWGVRTFLVFSDSKESAKSDAIKELKQLYPTEDVENVKVRDVTSAKKYN